MRLAASAIPVAMPGPTMTAAIARAGEAGRAVHMRDLAVRRVQNFQRLGEVPLAPLANDLFGLLFVDRDVHAPELVRAQRSRVPEALRGCVVNSGDEDDGDVTPAVHRLAHGFPGDD